MSARVIFILTSVSDQLLELRRRVLTTRLKIHAHSLDKRLKKADTRGRKRIIFTNDEIKNIMFTCNADAINTGSSIPSIRNWQNHITFNEF